MKKIEVDEPIVRVDQSTVKYFREHLGQVIRIFISTPLASRPISC
jgi:hypothetical protein